MVVRARLAIEPRAANRAADVPGDDHQLSLQRVLEVERVASDAQLKAAFRKLAMQWHPDRNPDDKSEHKFKEINEAYEVLKDADKRAAYDRFGHAAFEQGGGAGGNFGAEFGSAFSDLFEGKTRLEQHRMVFRTLQGRIGADLHALQLTTRAKG